MYRIFHTFPVLYTFDALSFLSPEQQEGERMGAEKNEKRNEKRVFVCRLFCFESVLNHLADVNKVAAFESQPNVSATSKGTHSQLAKCQIKRMK